LRLVSSEHVCGAEGIMDGEGLAHGTLSENIIGIFHDVYNELGHGFLEGVHEQARAIALDGAGVKVERQPAIPVWFCGQQSGDFRAEVMVEEKVPLELKAARAIEEAREKQLLNYLQHNLKSGCYLIWASSLKFRRLVYENGGKKIRVDPRGSAAEKVLT